MSRTTKNLPRAHLQMTIPPASLGRSHKLRRAIVSSILSPAYWLMAHCYGTPGLQFQLDSARLGLRILLNRKTPTALGWAYHLLFSPIDSTRYFEFDFAWRALAVVPGQRYLDVSSPRLFPILLMTRHRTLTTELINPDAQDMAATMNLIQACGLDQHCRSHVCTIEAAPLTPESFDFLTSLSVVEHIPEVIPAIQKMWALLKSRGRLLLSLPCAKEASEQYVNHEIYGVVRAEADGPVFFQTVYDEALLHERIFRITGQPVRSMLYGETRVGFLRDLMLHKAQRPDYNYAREPYLIGRAFRRFEKLADLPGEGVLAMEFVKP